VAAGAGIMNLHYVTPTTLRAVARRLIGPAVVLVVLGGFIIYLTVKIDSENETKLGQIGTMLWQIDEIDTRIANLAKDLNVVRTLGQRYGEIEESGFVGEQSRLRAAQLLEELGPKYDLSVLRYDFMPQVADDVHGEQGTEFHLASTEIALDVKSVTDTQLLGFVAEFTDRLGGQVQVRKLQVQRTADISDAILEDIASGERPELFSGEILLTWNNVTIVVDGNAVQ
jgi:hypothetical protein